MYLQQLNLMNFKNYEELSIKLSPHINCFVGANGCGKTNLLDAIHYLSMTRSAFSSVETQNVKHKEKFFMISGIFQEKETQHKVYAGYKESKKSFQCNQKKYDRLSEHIGKFPSVLIAPNDTDIVREGSEERRKYFDSIIAQTDKTYLQNLIKYQHILKQRNKLLKMYGNMPSMLDNDLLQSYDTPLLKLAKAIHTSRLQFTNHFITLFKKYYQYLTENVETVTLVYKSDVGEEFFESNFKEALEKDLHLQRTTKGIHKDDYDFRINSYPLKKYGSQGQQKSYVIALKLAQFEIIHQLTNTKPLLLLDDIFDKLDDDRIGKLLQMITEHQFGQIFITDARPERTKRILENVNSEIVFFEVNTLSSV